MCTTWESAKDAKGYKECEGGAGVLAASSVLSAESSRGLV